MYYNIIIYDLFMFFIMLLPSYLIKFHPLGLNFLLIMYTIILSLKLNYFNSSYWYSYMLFLIIIGGIMIIFLYLTSISNNELMMFTLNYYLYMFMKFIIMLLIMLIFMNYYNFSMYVYLNNLEIFMLMKLNFENILDFKNLYMNLNMDMNIYMIIYLFLVMMMCVLICMKNSLPLRQMLN